MTTTKCMFDIVTVSSLRLIYLYEIDRSRGRVKNEAFVLLSNCVRKTRLTKKKMRVCSWQSSIYWCSSTLKLFILLESIATRRTKLDEYRCLMLSYWQKKRRIMIEKSIFHETLEWLSILIKGIFGGFGRDHFHCPHNHHQIADETIHRTSSTRTVKTRHCWPNGARTNSRHSSFV